MVSTLPICHSAYLQVIPHHILAFDLLVHLGILLEMCVIFSTNERRVILPVVMIVWKWKYMRYLAVLNNGVKCLSISSQDCSMDLLNADSILEERRLLLLGSSTSFLHLDTTVMILIKSN